jgi:hypothetical protein
MSQAQGDSPLTQAIERDTIELSLVRNDPFLRAQRLIGLAPKSGLGVARRALVLALVTWLPIAVWALFQGRAVAGSVEEPLLNHFGIHVRALLAIPMLVLAEAVLHGVTTRLMPQFVRAGLVPEREIERFRDTLRGIARLRDNTLPWVFVAGGVLALAMVSPNASANHELAWAGEAGHGFGFGAFWFSWVLRPIFSVLLLAWAWRLFLFFR